MSHQASVDRLGRPVGALGHAAVPEEGSRPPGGGRVGVAKVGGKQLRSGSPTVLLRISDDRTELGRAFSDFAQAVEAAEAYAGAGFRVAMVSATGRFLMDFRPRWPKMAV